MTNGSGRDHAGSISDMVSKQHFRAGSNPFFDIPTPGSGRLKPGGISSIVDLVLGSSVVRHAPLIFV